MVCSPSPVQGRCIIISADSTDGVHAESLLHLCYPVSDVSLSIEANPMMKGREYQLTANVTMRDQSCVNHLVTFTSSDETVATVDETGMVHAVGLGEAVLSATAQNGKTASITVSVITACIEHDPVTVPAVAPHLYRIRMDRGFTLCKVWIRIHCTGRDPSSGP